MTDRKDKNQNKKSDVCHDPQNRKEEQMSQEEYAGAGAGGNQGARGGHPILSLIQPMKHGIVSPITKADRENLLAEYRQEMNKDVMYPMTESDGLRYRSRARLARYLRGYPEKMMAVELKVGVRTVLRAESSTLMSRRSRTVSLYAEYFHIDEKYFTDPDIPFERIAEVEGDRAEDFPPMDRETIQSVIAYFQYLLKRNDKDDAG